MTLNEYLIQLQQFISENPKLADVKVAYATDDEGNSYSGNVYGPSIRYKFKSESDCSFETVIDKENDPEEYEDYQDELEPVVLIN